MVKKNNEESNLDNIPKLDYNIDDSPEEAAEKIRKWRADRDAIVSGNSSSAYRSGNDDTATENVGLFGWLFGKRNDVASVKEEAQAKMNRELTQRPDKAAGSSSSSSKPKEEKFKHKIDNSQLELYKGQMLSPAEIAAAIAEEEAAERAAQEAKRKPGEKGYIGKDGNWHDY